MAMFYGTVQGGRTQASRLGHANTGLRVSAQSYDGSIVVRLFERNGDTHADISLSTGSSSSGDISIYHGPIKRLFDDQLSFNFGR